MNLTKLSIGAAILAGGKNSRMNGIDKAFLPFKNSTLIENTVSILSKITDEIIIVTDNPIKYKKTDFNIKNIKIVSDHYKNIGPLGGIHSALNATTKEKLFIAACDMPNINAEFILQMIYEYEKINNCEALIPKINDCIEPLHAIYNKNIFNKLVKHLEKTNNYKISRFLKKIKTCYYNIKNEDYHKRYFKNINNIEDINIFL